ncbi:MAG: [Fe-Fe] hydrogenase large subunit C-terminal domain-containing protein [archaeon]
MNKKSGRDYIENLLKNEKCIALLAPSFVVNFKYPAIIYKIKRLGFDKVTELTFGAKMVNGEYHKILKKTKNLVISSPCPGVVTTIKNKFPHLTKNLAKVDSPIAAMAKISKKHLPKHKVIFISPCDFKKVEAENSKYIDGIIDYEQLVELFKKYKIRRPLFFPFKIQFDKFYNDYTKIYPLSGGLAKTAHLKGIIKEDEIKIIDGINEIIKFLKNPDPKIKFLDCLFCPGGCIGGPHTNQKLSIEQKHKKVMDYLKKSKLEDIPEDKKGLIKLAKGIKFSGDVWFK